MNIPNHKIQSIGLSHRKVEYIKNTYNFFHNNKFDFEKLSDEDVIKELTKIKGVGEWTAQMFLIFNLWLHKVFAFSVKDNSPPKIILD
mgnify:CR=1 FL=1